MDAPVTGAQIAGGVVYASIGAVPAAFGLYNFALAAAALFHRPRAGQLTPTRRIAVLVPAHDEAALISRCIASLEAQTYPRELYEVIVIADNCTDATASIAATAGAEVLVRDEPDERGKGRALRWAIEQVIEREPPPDAIAVVDADSVAAPTFLECLGRPFEDGAQAVQGESLLIDEGTPASSLRSAAFLLVNRVRPSGRALLGLPSQLGGNGMLFARELLRAHPWDAFSSTEDIEYAVKLRAAGVKPAFAAGAVVESPTAPTADAATQQQLRWEGGKVNVARTHIPHLLRTAVRTRTLLPLDAALELAVPPLGLLAAAGVAGTLVGTLLVLLHVVPFWALVPWLVAVAAIPLYVFVGLAAARAPRSAYRAMLRAPGFVFRKALHAHRLLTFRADTWVRTERAGPDDSAGEGDATTTPKRSA
jgi:cellulose synthase/poly-beta-1,6-N-acetylglucosamine synthase-like glycosyltransferase